MMKKKNKKLFIEHDFTSDLLPQSRKSQFFDILKIRYFTLLRIGLILVLLFIPLLVKSYLVGSYNNAITLNIEQKVISEADGEGARKILMIISSLSNLVLYPIAFMSFAGSLRVIRQLCYSEGIIFKLDYRKGFKDNVLFCLLVGFILALFEAIMMISLIFLPMTFISIFLMVLFFIIVFPISFVMIYYSTIYKNSFIKTLYHSLFVYFKSNWRTLIFILCLLGPILAFEFGANLVLIKELIYAFLIIFILPIILLGGYELYLYEFDRAFNLVHMPELVRKGLYIPEEEKAKLFKDKEEIISNWSNKEDIKENKTQKKILFEIIANFNLDVKRITSFKRIVISNSEETYLLNDESCSCILFKTNQEYLKSLSNLKDIDLLSSGDDKLINNWAIIKINKKVKINKKLDINKIYKDAFSYVSDFMNNQNECLDSTLNRLNLKLSLDDIIKITNKNDEINYYLKRINDLYLENKNIFEEYKKLPDDYLIFKNISISEFLVDEFDKFVLPYTLPDLAISNKNMGYALMIFSLSCSCLTGEIDKKIFDELLFTLNESNKKEIIISLKAYLFDLIIVYFNNYLSGSVKHYTNKIDDNLIYLDNVYSIFEEIKNY